MFLHPVRFCQLTHFNSIKVRLKQVGLARYLLAILFQFHKGTIKTCRTVDAIADARKFQFHTGTIRTVRAYLLMRHDFLFQFHKGTIKTCLGQHAVVKLDYFNSIKVRLKPKNEEYREVKAYISIP